METSLTLPAPAKLNLFLHILGRRADGYHQLQTLMQLVDYADDIEFSLRKDGVVNVMMAPSCAIESQDNIVSRAANLLQVATHTIYGADIKVQKRIPIGGGLGGGSSDAATTLLGLNKLWGTKIPLITLANMGIKLGADVPLFVYGQTAWAEGIGDVLTPFSCPEQWYIVLTPSCHISTAEIFSYKQLTRDTTPIKMSAFQANSGFAVKNDCEKLVRQLYPEVNQAIEWLNQYGQARLTGTGACVFAGFHERKQAEKVLAKLPAEMVGFMTQGLTKSPVHERLDLVY